jgi:CHAT domain-containing protein
MMTTPDTKPIRTALLNFLLRSDELVAFAVHSEESDAVAVPIGVSQEEVAEAAAKLHQLFHPLRIHARRPERTTDMYWLKSLASRLLDPIREHLDRCDQLVIAPHAELHLLPIHLLEPESHEPLAVTHSITYVPNLSLYALLLRRQQREDGNAQPRAGCLSTAAVEDGEDAHACFREAPALFAELTNGKLLTGVNASKQAFVNFANSSDLLFLSCHGRFDQTEPLRSSLLLSDGRQLPTHIGNSHGLSSLSVREIIAARIRSRLVILQACTSGTQTFAAGDEPTGFPAAFLLGGAAAVVASSWVVERNSAREFMKSLVERWTQSSCTIAQAMLHAYGTTRKHYPHPFHWAPFSLFGNDRLRFHDTHSQGRKHE